MKLFDRKGNPVEVPDDQLHEALSSGNYGAPKGTLIPVRMGGQVGTVPVENLSKAIHGGGAEVVPQSVYDAAELQAKYGDAKHQAIALGAEAANTATLGISNAAIRGLGGKEAAETVRKSQEANPVSTGVGTAIGIAGPIAADIASGGALTPELAAVAAERAAARGAEGAVARGAARGVEGTVARGAEEAASLGAGERRLLAEGAGAARAEAPSRALPGRVFDGVLEDAPRGLPRAGEEMAGEVLHVRAPGQAAPLALPPSPLEEARRALPGIAPEIEAEILRAPGALSSRPLRTLPARAAEFEEVGVRAAQDAPEIAQVVGAPRPPPATPGIAAAEEAARVERLTEAARVVEEARTAGASVERAAAEASGKGVVREAVEGALFGPTRLVNRGGEAVENAVRGIIGREAETALGRIAQDAVVKAARGAVEGGIYSVGNEVGHQFLQDDPDLSGERLAAAWFNGAVLGGGFGLLTGAAGRGAKEAIGKVVGDGGISKFLVDKAGEHMWHAAGATKKMTANAEKYAGGVAKVGNLIREDAEKLMGRTPRTREELAELAELMQKKHREGLDAVLNRLDESAIDSGKGSLRLKDLLKHIETIEGELKDRAADHGTVTSFKNNVIDAAGARDVLTGEVNANAPVTFKQLRNFRVTADEKSKFNSSVDNSARDGFRAIRHKLESEIESAAEPHLNAAGGSLLKDYKAAKAGYQAGKLLEKAAASGVAGEKTNQFYSLTDKIFGLGAGAVVGHATGPLGAMASHQAAELASKYVRKNFDFVVSDVLAKLANVAKGAHVLDAAQATSERVQKRVDQGLKAVQKGLDGKHVGSMPVVPGPKTFEERRALLLNIAAQHEGVLEHLNTVTSPLNRAAPGVAASLNAAALRTVVYLMDALPKPPPASKASLTPQVDAKAWKPSDPQKAEFNRKYDMATNPELALSLVAAGTYTQAHDHALTANHPKMKVDAGAKLRAELDRRTKVVPPRMRSSVKLFLGVPAVDKSLGRDYQAKYKAQQKPDPPQSGLSRPLKLTNNTSLP